MQQLTLLDKAHLLQQSGQVLDQPRQAIALQALSARYGLSDGPKGRVPKATTTLSKGLTPGPVMITQLTEAALGIRLRTTARAE